MSSHFSVERLRSFTAQVLARRGVPESDAALAARVLLLADLRGIDSHGIARLPMYVEMLETGEINPTPKPRVVRESPSTATIDADNGLGLVVAPKANAVAIERAARSGTGWVAVRNTNHFGIAGYYALEAVAQRMIGWAMTNTTMSVAPLWGAEMMLGTNPIAVAFPAKEEPPVVIDMATSVVTMGALEQARRAGNTIPLGWAIDGSGELTADPAAILNGGALLPLGGDREHGGHKGYCLGAMVDILSAVLSGANWGPFAPAFSLPKTHREPPVGKGIGHFFGAMRLDAFIDPDEFTRQLDTWIRTLRATKPAPGTRGPLIPGDPERAIEAERLARGIPLSGAILEDLRQLASRDAIEL
jgi:LDH2 family malate/lactate/ureidoglycolate dehydrogenase